MIYTFEAVEKAVLRASECKKIFGLRPQKSFFSRHGREGFWDKGIKGLRGLSAVGRTIASRPVVNWNFNTNP